MQDPPEGPGRRHHGWRHSGTGRRRWLEPFVLLLIAEGTSHGYRLMAGLQEMGVSGPEMDMGQIYRLLRQLEEDGSVESWWVTAGGPARRDYRLTQAGWSALQKWAAVMDERQRLSVEFLGRFAELGSGGYAHAEDREVEDS